MSDPLQEAREMLAATWTLVHGDRPSLEADEGFRWVALAALRDGRVMVGGPFPSREAGVATVMDVLEDAAQALEWAVWRLERDDGTSNRRAGPGGRWR